jgi:hypothetical protein
MAARLEVAQQIAAHESSRTQAFMTGGVDLAKREVSFVFSSETPVPDGKTLAEWLRRNWAVKLSVRQCQRVFGAWASNRRKLRPLIAHADPLVQHRRHGSLANGLELIAE